MKRLMRWLFAAFIVSLPLATGAAETRTVTLDVKNMSCAACPITVKKAITKVPGVVSAKVDYESKTAVVTFDRSKAGVEVITAATTHAGYPSSLRR